MIFKGDSLFSLHYKFPIQRHLFSLPERKKPETTPPSFFPLCFVAATFPFAGDFSATVLSRSNCSCAKLRLVLAHLLSPLARSLITGIGRAAVFFLPRGRQQRSREPSPWTALDTAPPSLLLLASCSPVLVSRWFSQEPVGATSSPWPRRLLHHPRCWRRVRRPLRRQCCPPGRAHRAAIRGLLSRVHPCRPRRPRSAVLAPLCSLWGPRCHISQTASKTTEGGKVYRVD